MSFDLDQAQARVDAAATAAGQHVFIAGLARAGTTLLMRRFHASGRFRSLTYRDMPFVLAPNMWGRLSRLSRRDIALAERAHGDSLLVDADSPESFDEVFWRVFAGDEYLGRNELRPHVPKADVVEQFVRYVGAILAADDSKRGRYLSKNNNNILRLGALCGAFPVALVLIPFREPLQHAHSLWRQHQRFSKIQAEREFTLAYMTWLGHHEFGLDHRPFRFPAGTPAAHATDTVDYWLHLWCETYAWLERSKPAAARFVCYEDLCTRPETWARLARLAGIAASGEGADPLNLSAPKLDVPCDRGLAERAAALYLRLVSQSQSDLG